MRSYLAAFKRIRPQNELEQSRSVAWTCDAHLERSLQKFSKLGPEEVKAIFEKYGLWSGEIKSRGSFCDDMGSRDWQNNELFNLSNHINPTMQERVDYAQKKIESAFEQVYQGHNKAPDHLLHVSCTLYRSPSAAQKILNTKRWQDSTIVTHLYHMGCYAALPAVRTSHALSAAGAACVHINHSEVCSFHMGSNLTAEQVIVQTLFADGFINYQLWNEEQFKKNKSPALEILALKEMLIPDSEQHMSWSLASHGMAMTLSKSVPLFIGKRIEKFFIDLFATANLDYFKDHSDTDFAIHPGGPKILDLTQKVLDLKDDQIQYSRNVLAQFGNMSSATLPHVWDEALTHSPKKYLATVAFGPGLTVTGGLFRLCR